jgi:hypothetical protein
MESSLRLSAVSLLKKQQGSDLLSVSLFDVKRYHDVFLFPILPVHGGALVMYAIE